jgi:hypothetical protein
VHGALVADVKNLEKFSRRGAGMQAKLHGERIKIKNHENPQILRIDAEKSLRITAKKSQIHNEIL